MTATRKWTLTIGGLALVLAALPALAQGGPHGGHHGERGGPGPGGDGHRIEHMALRLGLSDAQREELRAAFEERFEAGAEAHRALFEARQALDAEIHAETFDEQAIRGAAEALSALEADLAVERARQAQKMRQILTPEQLVELDEMRSEGRRFGRHGGRGRGSRGPGGAPPVGG